MKKSKSVSHSVMSNSYDPMDYSPPGSSIHRILQARILEWVANPFSRGSSQPRDRTHVSCMQILYYLNHQGSLILLQGIYPRKKKTLISKDMCAPLFPAALLTITKIQKQPKFTSTDD